MMMSVLLDTSFLPVSRQFDLSICAALGVVAALHSAGLAHARVKWPNDLFAGDRKVGGILIENTVKESKLRASVVGIGINIRQNTFGSPNASSLELEGCAIDRNTLAERVCEHLEHFYLRLKEGENLRGAYLSVLFGKDEERTYSSDHQTFRGIIRGISDEGQLIVESSFPKKRFDIREITFCF